MNFYIVAQSPGVSNAEGNTKTAKLPIYEEIEMDKSNEIEMDVNNAYESIIIPPSLSAPPVPPATAERLVIDM